MYSDLYPQLKAKYNFDNFEIVLEVLDKQFGDLFKLSVLNSELRVNSYHQGSYLHLFDSCMKKLKGLYTTEEVTHKLAQLIQPGSEVHEIMTHKHIFVPKHEHGLDSQIGYIEKLMSGELTPAEPLTYLDMVRATNWMSNHGFKPSHSVAHINLLHALKPHSEVLFVNFNKDPKGMPKWGVVDLRDLSAPKVYCEAPLLEGEKLALEEGLKLSFTPDVYLGGTAAFSVSTGLTALAWANEHIKRTCALTLNSDFYALTEEFIFIQDTRSLYNFTEESFYSPSFKRYASQGNGLYQLARATILGELGVRRFAANDFCKALEVIEAEGISLSSHPQVDINARSFVLGLDAALVDLHILQENADSVTLKIPEYTEFSELQNAYSKYSSSYVVSTGWLEHLKRNKSSYHYAQEDMATAMVLSVFRGRAKKQKLSIELPNSFTLNEQEQRLILTFMEANPYVTELQINNNPSLQKIKDRLTPTFARNKWLAANGYRPPMADNYWKQAAKYWLIHLHEKTDILSPKVEHALFKLCVKEMGIQGLKAVLEFLNDESERELIERVYGSDLPAFYLACPPSQTGESLQALIKYLKQKESYFPFSELGLSYHSGNDALLIDLLEQVNQLERFEQIVLTDLLVDKVACHHFLAALARRAFDHQWVGLIVIPELEDIENASDELRDLQNLYAQINNVILHNRHKQAALKTLQGIKNVSDFNVDGNTIQVDGTEQIKTKEDDEAIDLDLVFEQIASDASWPLKRGGAVQLQLQQQQQIEQSRQIQQEQQHVHIHTVEESLLDELVDHKNIDRLLSKFLAAYISEHTLHVEAAALKETDETLLQGFFHTWVNANPKVNARYAIHYMTQDAVKALIRHHQLLPSGLNPDNLPKGFYTQRSKDGHLILCYNAELAYINRPNSLTINLDVHQLDANAWEGDFRLFNLTRFLDISPKLDAEDWLDIALFAQMQPSKNHTKDVDDFCSTNSDVAKHLGLHASLFTFGAHVERRKKIADNWDIFIQVWHYAGEAGIAEFLQKEPSEFKLNFKTAAQRLLRNQSKSLQAWALSLDMNEHYVRALGQVFYRYGDQGLTLLLTKFQQIETSLGTEFFKVFNDSLLKKCANFNSLMHEPFFTSMDSMIVALRPSEAQGSLRAWQAVLARHTQAVGWDNVDSLWKGFAFFLAELEQQGLALEGNEFDEVQPENMLVCMDRILASLKHVPDAQLQQQFLQRLGSMDRTHGGVPYALQYERFKYFDDTLKLTHFAEGNPTYAPALKELFSWVGSDAEIKMRRTLASQSQFSHAAYPILSERLANAELSSKNLLMWLLHMQYPMNDIAAILAQIEMVDAKAQAFIAKHLHNAVYQLGNQHLSINLEAVCDFIKFFGDQALDLCALYPNGTVLEAMSIVHQAGRWNDKSLNALNGLLQSDYSVAYDYPQYLAQDVFKLAALFGIQSTASIQKFYDQTQHLLPIAQKELRLLITQLLSVDFTSSPVASCDSLALWQSLLHTVEKIKNDPANTAVHRIAFIEELSQQEWHFKYSKTGAFRALTTKEADGPDGLSFFIDHEDRIWRFMQAHVAVPVEGDARELLQPIIRFLKRLQLNRTYLNEIEPLLSSLEKTPGSSYWTAHYFYGLLRALQPEDDQVSFPISLLNVILQEQSIAAKPIDSLEHEFPSALIEPLQTILKNSVFNRKQQALLCQILLREFNWQNNIALLPQILATFTTEHYSESRAYVLDILAKSKNFAELESRYNNCLWLLQRTSSHEEISNTWATTSAVWLKAMSNEPQVEALFAKVQKTFALDAERQALLFHIIAWSSIDLGLKTLETHGYELNRKAPKLVERLALMSEGDLRLLARCYPKQPAPGADDILRMVKKHETKGVALSECINQFLAHPFSEPRADYKTVAHTREADVRRMIKATQISHGVQKIGVSAKQAAQITLIFSYLKDLEQGSVLVKGANKPISAMTQPELAEAFMRLSQESAQNPSDDLIRAQVWALLFQALGHTTRKYPHLAQQFALIANDVCIDSSSRVLQLATGEGKSHFVAMRAARYAACGKIVDVCTAKRTLAKRDLEDYQDLFNYLGFKAAYIHPKSTGKEYLSSVIHYTTAGDLSLFLDEQSYLGQPIVIEKNKRVGLFDEFDFIRFEEGRKTEYNYARPTGKTPKQMTWFYQAINEFYTTNKKRIIETDAQYINKALLVDLTKALQKAADDNDERNSVVKQILRDPLQLVQWIQSAHEAHELEWGVGFTVIEENIEVGDESYPMREIIPLSSDNQKMAGSTFSAGVQQLLAVRLNNQARLKGEPQNFHIHPESHIISSQVAAQRMKELWETWEGFSGTISVAQASGLYAAQGTKVLHVPTNQRDLRYWHKPNFYDTNEVRLDALVEQIRACLSQQKSILFSCKNDKQVAQLQEQLKTRLSAKELEQFIFYTNEEHRTASEVLDDKHKAEAWHGGKKQKGIALVASGFGRGDNVGVEAVFLFNVNDTNDLLQKGGRTARNGEEGEVFQFYLTEELTTEEKVFKQILAAAKIDLAALDDKLKDVAGETEEERCFERVMLLREYVFSLENQSNQGYHNVLAQYSAWGMKHLGVLNDPTQRNSLTIAFSHQLKRLEKLWIDISAKEDTTTATKISTMEAEVVKSATEFTQRYNSELGMETATPFKLIKQEMESIDLVVAKTHKQSAVERAIASICTTFMTCLQNDRDVRAAQIPGLLDVLSKNKKRLISFAKEAADLRNTEQLFQHLELAIEQINNPSLAWKKVSTVSAEELEYEHVLAQVAVREPFEKAMNRLIPSLQTFIIETLRQPSLLSVEERIHTMLPVLTYLGTFSRSQQSVWGQEYIEELDSLLHENPMPVVAFALNNNYPMSFNHFNGLMHLAQRFATDEYDFRILLNVLGGAIKNAPEQRVRMVTKWESLTEGMDKDRAREFLISFCHTMECFIEGTDWNLFTSLVNKTETWWNKGEPGVYQQQLQELWQLLASKKSQLPNELLKWSLGLPGKSWFQIITLLLEVEAELLANNTDTIRAAWEGIDTQSLPKSVKIEQFQFYLNSLSQLNDILGVTEAQLVLDKLVQLPNERKKRALELAELNKELFVEQPQIFKQLMNYFIDDTLSLEQVEQLVQIVMQVVAYQKQHPQVNIDYLLSGVDLFNKQSLAVLLVLNKIIQAHPEHTEKVLFDNAAESIAKVSNLISPLVEHVVTTFYQQMDTHNENPKAIIGSAVIDSWFQFDNPEDAVKQKRLAFMQLIYSKNLVTKDTGVAASGTSISWDAKLNDDLFQLGLNQYVAHTQAVLHQPKAQFNLHKVRDLQVEQQVRLLQVADEMKQIGTLHLFSSQEWDTDNEIAHLNKDLHQIIDSYKSSSFKSTSRKNQIAQIEGKINSLGFFNSKRESRYELVLRAISEAKITAINSDIREDRSRWFKMNRGGESRYYNTLNQMQDLVLRHWANDDRAIHRLQTYEDFTQNEFKQLVSLLQERITDAYPKLGTEGSRTFGQRISRFFTSKSTQQKIDKVHAALDSFLVAQDDTSSLTSEQVNSLMTALKQGASKLPGHLVTLTNELLARGDAIQQHLAQKETKLEVTPLEL